MKRLTIPAALEALALVDHTYTEVLIHGSLNFLFVPGGVQNKLVDGEVSDGEDQHDHDHDVENSVAGPNARPGLIEFRVLFQTLRGPLEDPCQNQCRHKAHRQDGDHVANCGVGKSVDGQKGLADLNDQPCASQVGYSYTNDIAVFQFIE